MPFAKIGFIGFGEVARTFSGEMARKGARVCAYDIAVAPEGGAPIPAPGVAGLEIELLPLQELVRETPYLFSTVPPQEAEKAAAAASEHLKPGHLYIDLCSSSPSVKRQAEKVVLASGAGYVEGAILEAVGVAGPKARVLLSGSKAREVADLLNRLGLNAACFGEQVGRASMFKMLRSIFSKGIENLLIELLLAARRSGLGDDLWRDITQLFAENAFDRLAENWIRTHAGACERRYHEMVQVVDTMRELGVAPIMAGATRDFFKRSLSLGIRTAFPEKPASLAEVIAFLDSKTQATA